MTGRLRRQASGQAPFGLISQPAGRPATALRLLLLLLLLLLIIRMIILLIILLIVVVVVVVVVVVPLRWTRNLQLALYSIVTGVGTLALSEPDLAREDLFRGFTPANIYIYIYIYMYICI